MEWRRWSSENRKRKTRDQNRKGVFVRTLACIVYKCTKFANIFGLKLTHK